MELDEEDSSSEDDELLCELDVYMSHNALAAKSEKVRVQTLRVSQAQAVHQKGSA